MLDDHLWGIKEQWAEDLALVLIPLLLDDPLWASTKDDVVCDDYKVLAPLLLDDPLWEVAKAQFNRM